MIVGGLPPRKSVTARPLSHHPQYLPIGGCFLECRSHRGPGRLSTGQPGTGQNPAGSVDSRVERRRRQSAHRRLPRVHGRQPFLTWALCEPNRMGNGMQLLVTEPAVAAYSKEMWTVQVHGGCQSWTFPVFSRHATDPSPGRASLCDHGRDFGLEGTKILTTGRSCATRRRRDSGHGA